MQKINSSVSIRKDLVLSNGNTPIFIRVYIDNKYKRLKVPNIDIKYNNWDFKNQTIKKQEPFYYEKNQILNKFKYKIEKIIYSYTINDEKLTFAIIKEEIYNNSSSIKYYDFALNIIESEIKNANTKKAKLSNIRKVKSFNENLLFTDIDIDFIKKYENYLKETYNNSDATITKALKELSSFCKRAVKKKIITENPFQDYKIKRMKSRIEDNLNKDEFITIFNYYMKQMKTNEKRLGFETLRGFIFSCFSGLRYSDVYNLKHKNIIENKYILIKQVKTGEIHKHPLTPLLLDFIGKKDSDEQKVFKLPTNQATNRYLKLIAHECNIKKEMTFHFARRTFATLLYNATGDIRLASKMTGHKNLDVTIESYAESLFDTQIKGLEKFENYIFNN